MVAARTTGTRSLWRADVAQLVAHHLAKVRVAGSNPVVRSERSGPRVVASPRWSGREARQRPAKPCTRVQIPSPPRTRSTEDNRIPGRLAQWERASLTRKRSLVQTQYRPPSMLAVQLACYRIFGNRPFPSWALRWERTGSMAAPRG